MRRFGYPAMLRVRRLVDKLARLNGDQRGTAAIEFSVFAGLVSFAVLNTTDISIYMFQRMELQNAAQVGVQAAWKTCDIAHLPATTNCPGLTNAITKAVQSTSLGTGVTLQSGSPSEGYYCVNSSNALQRMSDVSSKPADCSAAGNPTLQPSDYITITATYTYKPLFPGLTVAGKLTTPITQTAFMRLD